MIDILSPFVVFAECEVRYEGRAASKLARGNYLLIYKPDGCFMVSAGDSIGPRNYQGSKTKLNVFNNIITAVNRKETITITIYNEIWSQLTPTWSNHPVIVTKTEKELVTKIATNPLRYLGFVPDQIHLEFPTANGPVDIVAVKDSIYHVIEVKRKTLCTNHAVQLKKYLECISFQTVGYVAAPAISASALLYINQCGLKFIEVNWDIP